MLASTWRGAQEHCRVSLREVSHHVQPLPYHDSINTNTCPYPCCHLRHCFWTDTLLGLLAGKAYQSKCFALQHVTSVEKPLQVAFDLTRVCAGTRSVGMMFRAVVFAFMPTAIELILVCTLLAQRFKPAVALAVLATFVAYVAWTTVMTKVCHAAFVLACAPLHG